MHTKRGRKTLSHLARNWALLFLICMLILFSILGKNFFGLRNFSNIVLAATTLLLLATGETFVIISGVLIIGILELGLVNLGVPTYNLYIAVGCILILAVLIDQFLPKLLHGKD